MLELFKTALLRPIFAIGIAVMTALLMTDKPIPDSVVWATILTLVFGSFGWTNWKELCK